MHFFGFFKRPDYSVSLRAKLSTYFLIISIFPLILISSWAYYSGKESTEDKIMAHLISLADLKKRELENWLTEKFLDLKIYSEDPLLALYMSKLKSGEGKVTDQKSPGNTFNEDVFNKLQSIKTNIEYKRVFVMDLTGKVMVSTEEEDVGKIESGDYVTEPLATREIFIKNIFQPQEGKFSMIFSSPLYRTARTEKNNIFQVIGIMAIEIDMEETLFPMIGHWPAMGKTGETLLVRREENNVLFLNDLRHKRDAALNMRIPDDSNLATPAIFSSDGDEGFLIALDYRGVEVLSAYRHIPIMGWGFVAKIDSKEALSSVVSLRNRIMLFSFLLISAAIGLAFWVSRDVTKPILSLEKMTRKIAGGDFSTQIQIKTSDEIGQLANSFNKMTDDLKNITASRDDLNKEITERKQAEAELEVKNAELERFTYTVSHDLKSPLITIRGFLGLLDKDANSGDFVRMRADIKKIFNATEKMHKLLEDLLELSRVGRLANPFEEVSLGKLANEMVKQLEKDIKDLGIHVKINPELPLAHGDSQRLLEVFQNLIENAMKFMGDQQEPRIEIGVKNSGSETICYVCDNGIGIDTKHHDKIFDLFSRLNTDIEGTGVGLAIVKRIIELHGGRVWVESEGAGKGSTFCFVININ